ncbi:hypothetical protein QOZ84_00820 [Romboutsia sedimentorum]|uniref:Uncharacterized protein n=1 Tax=Romboutsia sedimentorum TaxID=1368474 RepID=A0ABT7E7N0_9FIRM|nr:hypothetical protein [Romboutsia sedimentorum]MDK2562073.1 hypothetical protein [Romboutsia sedimentorum]MDK2584312.1 hypothetical protein [Romboutsia sedimentorum]
MKNCGNCGIGNKREDGTIECVKYKKIKNALDNSENCLYYTVFKFEDGELMNPLQHLLLKEQDLKSKHMKNTI